MKGLFSSLKHGDGDHIEVEPEDQTAAYNKMVMFFSTPKYSFF